MPGMEYEKILKQFEKQRDPDAVAGMARYGIKHENAYGISIPTLRRMAREIGRDRRLAQQLWKSRIHEGRILAGMIDDPAKVTERQLERWVLDFDSWDLCDQCCSNLFRKTPFAWKKAVEWSGREEEFVKRAGFTLMACLAVHDKASDDKRFERLFVPIRRGATDERNFVRKAVNWALRQIGKRNAALNRRAIAVAIEIKKIDTRSARWIASDALRELRSAAVQQRLRRKRER
jgi:3-methyladenine DNA glycosylase AlkD